MLMAKVSFQMSNVQHKEWFIVVLLPHIRGPLMQQKIVMQMEALELVMNLEASPIRDGATGMIQIQSQKANLKIQLQDIKGEKRCRKTYGDAMQDQWTYQRWLSGLHELHLIWCTKPIKYPGAALVQRMPN